MAIVVRYLLPNGEVKERFLCFIPIEQHDSLYMEEKVTKMLVDMDSDIKKCRGQTYNNAANMVGQYTGLQAQLKEYSPTAVFLPCTSHSFNLVRNFAAESCNHALHYFDFAQNLFTFFAASTCRQNILKNKLQECGGLTLKRISGTRWSTRADDVNSLRKDYEYIKAALIEIANDNNEKQITILESKKLMGNFAFMTLFWNNILQRINATNKTLQSVEWDILKGSNLLKSLAEYIKKIREDYVRFELEASELIKKQASRIKKQKPFF